MPTQNEGNGANPGDNTGADKTGVEGNATPEPKGGTKPADNAETDSEAKEKLVSMTQAEFDAIVARKVKKATKDADEKAALSETEKLKLERDNALKLVVERDLKDEFIAATGLDVAKGSRFFSMYRDEIDLDDAGKKSTNMSEVVKKFKADFPEMFKKTSGGGDGGQGQGGKGGNPAAGGMNSLIRKMAGR